MVQRQRRYALFALGMVDVTVGSFVVALLDVGDNFNAAYFLERNSNLVVILLRSETEEVISCHFEAEP